MRGTVPTGRNAMHAALVCLALLVVAACSEEARRPESPIGPTETPVTPAPVWNDLGEYAVIMTAAPSCSVPDYAMTHTYNGRLKERGRDLVVTFSSQQFIAEAGSPGFAGTRDGETVRFTINGDYYADGYAFVYQVEPGKDLGYAGTAIGTMADGRIVTTLNGTLLIRAYDLTNPYLIDVVARCDATDHRMELVRN